MRLEQLIAKALEKVNNDRYILSMAVSQRAKELANGAKPLSVNQNLKNMKYSDVALYEIANGLLEIDELIENKDF